MNIHLLLLPIVSFSILSLGVLAYSRDRKSATNRAFLFLSFALGGWVFIGGYVTNSAPFILSNLTLWMKITFIFGYLMGTSILYLALVFPNRTTILKWYAKLWLLLGVIFLPLIPFTNLLLGETEFVGGQLLSQNGPLYPAITIWGVLSVLISFTTLFLGHRRSSGLAKTQFKYVFLGIFLFGFMATTFNLIIPVFGFNQFLNFGLYAPTFLIGFIGYAIIKHRLWDIRLVLLKSLTFSLIILVLASLYIFIIYFLKDYLSLFFNISPNITFVVAGLFIAFGFSPFKRLVERLTDKIFFKGRYNPPLVLKKLVEIMRSTLDLKSLAGFILSTLKEEMRLGKVGLLLMNQDKKERSFTLISRGFDDLFNEDRLVALVSDKNVLVADEVDIKTSKGQENLYLLRNQEISVIIPLRVEKRLIGILILGEKKSGDMFSLQDINFLLTLSSQLSIAINNALSFDEVVKDREKIKRLLFEREALDKMKDEFIAIASHEVNTPLTIAQGYLSLVLEGTIGKLDKKPRSFLTKAFEGIHRISSLISALMNASSIGQGKLKVNKVRINIDHLVKESLRTYLPYAKKSHIDLSCQKLKEPSYVFCDPMMIKEVLDHLISNGLKFSKTNGNVIVSLETKDDKLFVRVKDNGIGIDKEKLPHIFDKFYQGDTSFTRAAQGTGLGLYIAQSILKLHKSKIEVKSEKGKGSEFWFGLPYIKET